MPAMLSPSGRAVASVLLILSTASTAARAEAPYELVWKQPLEQPYMWGTTTDSAGFVYSCRGTSTSIQGLSIPTTLVKTDPSGIDVWATVAPECDDSSARVRTSPTGDVFVVAANRVVFPETYAVISQFDPDGDRNWTRRFGEGNGLVDEVYAPAVDPFGNLYFSGRTTNGIFSPASVSQAYLGKLDPAGNLVWGLQTGEPGIWTTSRGVATDRDGNVYMVGVVANRPGFINKYDSAGELLWTRQFAGDPRAPFADGNNNVYFSTAMNPTGRILKFDEDGHEVWSVVPPTDQVGRDRLGVDAAGNTYIGWTGPLVAVGSDWSNDAYISKVSSTGDEIWRKRINANRVENESFPANFNLAVSPSGDVYVSFAEEGTTFPYNDFYFDRLLVKLSPPPPPFPGDANGDRIVDRADLTIVAANLGTASGAGFAGGDFTGDGRVSLADLMVLQRNFGMRAPPPNDSPVAAVPEPSVLALLITACACWGICRKSRQASH